MLELLRRELGTRRLHVVATERVDGDMHPRRVDPSVLRSRQEMVAGRAWTMLDQVHGAAVVTAVSGGVADPDDAGDVPPTCGIGDVLVGDGETRVAMWAADCAVVVLAGGSGRIVGVHAGWRGLAAGALDVGVDALAEPVVAAVLGPVVGPCCYEFGADDLELVAAGVGTSPRMISSTHPGDTTRLDVPAAVRAALARRGVALDVAGPCTGCDDRWFSHRVRGDVGRHAVVAWADDLRSTAMTEPHADV